jgi:serine protease Do
MKKIFIKGFFAGLTFLSLPAVFAQQKTEKEKDVQQIIITRAGNVDVKTVIEISGNNVTVNGKPVKDGADSDVKVRVNKIRDVEAYAPGSFNFNFDNNNARALFSEDENRPMLGVVTEESSKGARINSVSKESGAEKAGLQKNDIITKVNDVKITTAGDVTTAIRKQKPGDKVTVTFLRDGKEQKVTAELGKWKGINMNNSFSIPRVERMDIAPFPPGTPFPYGTGGAPKLGLSVQDTEDGKGVKVLEVDEDSNAGKAGVKVNDIITHVNNEPVNTTDEIARRVRAEREKTSFDLKLLRNGKAQTIQVKTPRKLKTADL